MTEFPIVEPARALTSQSALETALEQAKDAVSLKTLNDQAAGLQELMRRMRLAVEEQNRLAKFRIRVERRLGLLLMQRVHRGGRGSNLHDASSIRGGSSAPLPEGISQTQSARFQELARIPDEVVAAYFADAETRGILITDAGLRRFAYPKARTPPVSARSRAPASELCSACAEVWEAVQRLMDVQVCVGLHADVRPLFPHARHVESLANKAIGGDVLAFAQAEPEVWLARLAGARSRGAVHEAMVLFQPWASQEWLGALSKHDWVLCFLRQPAEQPWALAYHGERKHAFTLVFREAGLVLRPLVP